jgi:hypothetical protein
MPNHVDSTAENAAMSIANPTASSFASTGTSDLSSWPAEVRALLEEIRRAKPVRRSRRRHPRRPYFALARMWQGESPLAAGPPLTVYTLDINPYALSFICSTPLDSGDPVVIGFREANGYPYEMSFSVYRCRELREGWFEAVVHRRK